MYKQVNRENNCPITNQADRIYPGASRKAKSKIASASQNFAARRLSRTVRSEIIRVN
jgi:hypothetical protein